MKFSILSAVVSFLSIMPSVFSLPVEHEASHAVEKRAVPGAPRWVAYWDAWSSGEVGPPAPSVISGFNVLILSFLLVSGPADQVQEWVSLTAAQRSSIKSQYAAAGISLMVSAFGSTDVPTSAGYDPIALANTMSSFVKTYTLDGIDVDYEDFAAINAGNGNAETWLISFTTQLRANLPSGQYIITHAPVAPWFGQANYPAGAYWKVNQQVGSLIDWYNVQFYNQGSSEYTTCAGLLTASSSNFPDTAVFQLNSVQGVPLSKIVIGKPGTSSDASNGYMSTSTLASCVSQAKNSGWTAGVMVWEYPDVGSAWITAVRASSWPVGSAPPPPVSTTSTISKTSSTTKATTTTKPPTSTTTTSKATTTTPPAGGQCSGVGAWNSATAYNGGAEVTYNGHLWTAKWWSEDDAPGGVAGDWTDDGPC